jgi:predicted nucleic-acid-binding Zn-ribbon protein
MSECKKCPKCGAEMEKGRDLFPASATPLVFSVHMRKPEDWIGDKIVPFHCRKCGYIELYTERKEST